MKHTEQDLHRFILLRNEIRDELDKIGPCIHALEDAGKGLITHFDVFRQLAKNTQEQLPAIIQAASHTMAKTAAEEFSLLIEKDLKDKVTSFNHSVHNASQVLNETMGSKYRKLCLLSFVGMALSGLMAFGGGVFYAQRNTYALPQDFIKMYALGLSVKEASSTPQTDPPKQKAKGRGVQKNKGRGAGG